MKRIGRPPLSPDGIAVMLLWKKIRSLGEEFLERTSMHGLKYIGGDHRPVIER